MAVPVFNPPIPYMGPIPDRMPPGKIIYIQGFIPPICQSFAVNLQCGPNINPRDDIALHINPRFGVNTVVRNSLQGQIWGVEDTSGHFPLQLGQQFELIILSEMDSYKIAFNGQHFAAFPFRIPVQRVCYLGIDGDVNIGCIRFEINMPQTAATYAPSQIPPAVISQPPGYSSGMLPMPPVSHAGYGSCPPPQGMPYGSSCYGVSPTHSPMHSSTAIPVPGHGSAHHGSHFHTAPISYPLGVMMGKHMSKEMKKMHKKEKKLFKHKHKHPKFKLKHKHHHHHGFHKKSSSSSSSD